MTSKAYDVIVLGGGAAGLMCAHTAAARGRSVLVLEKSNKVGKKILMSGGGRCNFTNLYVEPDSFISDNPHFCKSALSRYTAWDFIALVAKHDIAYEERKHGQLFCVESAKDILAMLLSECEAAGVEIETQAEQVTVAKTENSADQSCYRVEGNTSYLCESLVVATGALSIPTLGGSGAGYDLAKQFGLPCKPLRAGLVPLTFSDEVIKPLCERLAGVSVTVEVSTRQQTFNESLLFTHRGMSGPAILQISNYWLPGDTISINLLPKLDIAAYLQQAKAGTPKMILRNALAAHLPKALVAELQQLLWAKHSEQPLTDFTDSELNAMAATLAAWTLKPSGTEGYRTAEVTLGGIDTDAISSKTMEAVEHPGLFFIGEVVDVTGHLGGFNFQWAWSSGFVAGQHC